jgi:hypothetical protein
LRAPYLMCRVGGGQRSQFGMRRAGDRNRDQPPDRAAQKNQACDAEADDIADAEKGRREVDRAGHRGAPDPSRAGDRAGNEAENILRRLERGRNDAAPGQRRGAGRSVGAGAQDLSAGDPFGKRQTLVNDVSAPQENHQQTTHRAARQTQHRYVPIRQRSSVAENHQRRKGEDRARGDCFACRSDGLNDVVLEYRRPAEEAQHRHRDDRCRDTRRHRHAGVKTEISVGGAEDDRQDRAQDEGA